MMFAVVCAAAFAASMLTLVSGFGLGTLLMPAFALFFPVDVAVGLTAIVHLGNNVFKLLLLGRFADRGAVMRFGIPAVAAAAAGAWLLTSLPAADRVIGAIIVLLAVLELVPAFERLSFDRRWLPLGGAVSGFLGGLSGHQGALRSAFLVRAGLSKEGFIATGVVIACLVDVTRLAVYAGHFRSGEFSSNGTLVAAAMMSAFAGVVGGRRLLHKLTIRGVRFAVAAMLAGIGLGLLFGLI